MLLRTGTILIVALAMTGCASLPAVNNFSSNTVALADSIDRIAEDTSASCLRRLALDVPIRGIGDEQRKPYADACSQLKQSADLFIELNSTTRAYAQVLGQLADNQLVTFDAEVAGVQGAIAKLESSAGPAYFNTAQLNAVGSLADVVLRAATDAYRQKEIKRVLDHHEELVQLAAVLQTFIRRAYLPVLANEEGNLDSLEGILTDKYIQSEPLRTRELLELLKQQRVNLADRKKTANDALNSIAKMLEVHGQLLQNADNNEVLIGLLKDYGRQIRNVRKQIQSSF
jgi:hypothetical protein